MRYFWIAAPLMLIALIAVTFSPCVNNQFTNWDDNTHIVENDLIKDFSPAGIKKIFTSSFQGGYFPLTFLSFAVEYKLFQLNPQAYHLDNILMHMANALLVFILLQLLNVPRAAAFLAAALFAIHPTTVEVVAWATARKDLLYTFFYLAALIQYAFFIQTGRQRCRWWAFLLFTCALLAKAQAVSLPFILLAMDYAANRTNWPKLLREKIPFLALAFLFLIGNAIHLSPLLSDQTGLPPYSPTIKFLFINNALLNYAMKCLWPWPLSSFTLYPQTTFSRYHWIVYASPVLTALLLWLMARSARWTKTIVFASLFMFLTIALPCAFTICSGGAFMAERYLYLPLVGFVFLCARGYARLCAMSTSLALRVTILLITCLLTLSFASFQRCAVWKNSVSLWSDVIRQHANPVAYNSRGAAYIEEGQLPQALEDLNRALTLNPQYPMAYNNRGHLWMLLGQTRQALDDFNTSIRLDPHHALSYYKRAYLYQKMGNTAGALADTLKAQSLTHPGTAQYPYP